MAPVLAFRRIASRAVQTPPVRFALPRPALPAIHAPLRHNGRHASSRLYSSEAEDSPQPPEFLTEGERRVFDRIMEGLAPTKLEVQDISGGCGSMYALDIVSDQFKGLPIIKQHRLVNKVLGDEMKTWHGVQMKTKAP
ncbi:bola protein [Neohortaea acidophila]|uniref:Bola protein n=1 Tax=Neohortaea acidophila TaxID=245834 RepID=A0A6A6PNW1_9PEZI|nr:bola protein [Neohortaea acidophila]KAF2481759.1 bola protein [Neohortaea acidophila]